MRLVTAAEMREMDRRTIAGGHASGEALMERAGAGVVHAMAAHYGPLLALRVLILCGRGNNGGDGFVAARVLKDAGADPHVVVLGDAGGISGDARTHFERMREAGIKAQIARADDDVMRAARAASSWDFALDAMLGTGAQGEPRGLAAAGVELLRDLDAHGTRIVAVDLPTGLDADTGTLARRAVRADLTVTFGAPKRGQWLYPGRAFVGALEVVDIGLLPAADGVELATQDAMAALVPLRDPRAHKNSVGRLLVIGGSAGLAGAAALTARGGARGGAGYVRVAVPFGLADLMSIKLTAETVLAMPETRARTLATAALAPLRSAAENADAVAIGPGLSRNGATAALVRRLLPALPVPAVVDADALSAFAGRAAELGRKGAPKVLTPHLGELSRLTGIPAEELEAQRIDAARAHAKAINVVLVVKGAPTVTAAPDGRTTVNATGNAGLATLGSGDVLTGVIGALLAQGLDPYDAARLGVWLHGAAGDAVAARLGQHGMAADDLPEALALALRDLVRLREASAPEPQRGAPPATRRRPSAQRAPKKK